jgi:hypothetical protein
MNVRLAAGCGGMAPESFRLAAGCGGMAPEKNTLPTGFEGPQALQSRCGSGRNGNLVTNQNC